MRTISKEKLEEILKKHKMWLYDEEDGELADLSYADLRGVNLRDAFLGYANLKGADLRGVNLSHADLNSANLNGADLREADLKYADLRRAKLKYANLNDANLRLAKLGCAELRDAQRPWLFYTGSIGSRHSETLYFADYDNVQCGCWNCYKGGTLAEFETRVDETYPADSKNEEYQRYRLEYLLAIKMFEDMREAYLKSVAEAERRKCY